MQGLWKSEINGWKKDIKRKKINRKHFLKDKFNLIQKEILSNNFKEVETPIFQKEKNKFIYENNKFVYNSKELDKHLFNFDKYYYYGGYSEKVYIKRSEVKQNLKKNIFDFKFEKKQIFQYY